MPVEEALQFRHQAAMPSLSGIFKEVKLSSSFYHSHALQPSVFFFIIFHLSQPQMFGVSFGIIKVVGGGAYLCATRP
jgi:hypothetical protein